ncbi:RNA polymerase II-associated factor 1 homolog [Ornithodoros turicata]|uniref:RNA polymerase II-associated factor 1 homolog n=1 Tax=Ornithodoros turicata TaxID=34597 RepID=UPI003138663F
MAPTIQTGSAAVERDRKKAGERRSELVCRVRYCNTLPDIPFDPKFISYPFEPNRFVSYKATSLERNYKHDLLTEHDLGVTIDLIDPKTYEIDPNATLHPDDEKLLEEEALTPQDSKRSRHHNLVVPWLKKTEYIATEFNRYGQTGINTETKVGYNVKKMMKEEDLYMDRESQINAINRTFEEAQKPIECHYSKPHVKPVEILPLFPDSDLWKYPFAQVMFDSDPAPVSELEEMSQAMIRGVMDESGEQFVAYFLPTEDTIRKRKRDAEEGVEYMDDDEYEYRMAREYNWNVKNKASKGYEENYFFVFRSTGVFYNELETRVRLSKRRLKPGVQPNNSKLVVRHRPLNELEHKTQQLRLTQLEPPQEEEEEEEEEEQKNEEEEEEADEEEEKKESEAEEAEKSEESDVERGVGRRSASQSPSAKKSRSSGSSSSSSSASSGSSSSEEEEEEEEEKKRRDEEEIFGSGSDSD